MQQEDAKGVLAASAPGSGPTQTQPTATPPIRLARMEALPRRRPAPSARF